MEQEMPRRVFSWIGIGLLVIVVVFAVVYLWDINQSYERIQARGTVISTPYGDIEYTAGGSGPDVLVIHGAGGGYDQGELLVQAVLGDAFHWITPSRFGYLRSTFHQGATWDDQARVYALLLDRLGLKKVAVVALSQGGPSALLFAALYPERVSSLTLISCGVASSGTADQAQANKKGDMLKMIFQYDFLYWITTKLFKKQLMGLMGATDDVIDGLTPQQLKLAEQVIDYMNPVSPRFAGVSVDNTAKMPNERIAAIQAPTLVVHATDDMLQLYHNAEFASSTIPGAKLSRFERGGHLLMVVEQMAIRPIVQKHIIDNTAKVIP
ncbi:MAG: alpha/beta hydrolase [Gammaproteobacteria bacterium]|nr:alpha/beta hydrolase [Gammaproteobacteria bacterium]